MKRVIVEYDCDVDFCNNNADIKQLNLQVIFITEQTEGRVCKPYFQTKILDLCDNCYDTLMKGNYILVSGAMEHEKYTFNHKG